MIELINMRCRCDTFQYPYDFYIDRRSPVGNPYPLELPEDRDWSCNEYWTWFYVKVSLGVDEKFLRYIESMRQALAEHGKLRMFCWCAPLRCHGETIKEYLEK